MNIDEIVTRLSNSQHGSALAAITLELAKIVQSLQPQPAKAETRPADQSATGQAAGLTDVDKSELDQLVEWFDHKRMRATAEMMRGIARRARMSPVIPSILTEDEISRIASAANAMRDAGHFRTAILLEKLPSMINTPDPTPPVAGQVVTPLDADIESVCTAANNYAACSLGTQNLSYQPLLVAIANVRAMKGIDTPDHSPAMQAAMERAASFFDKEGSKCDGNMADYVRGYCGGLLFVAAALRSGECWKEKE